MEAAAYHMEYAQEVLAISLRYAERGSSLIHAVMMGASQCIELEHYPRQDIVDTVHGTRLYYHAHGSHCKPDDEHGHFHVFQHVQHGKKSGEYMHLVGLSLNTLGQPIRFFTTNRWVTGETWHSAAEVEVALAQFRIQTRGRLAPIARWVENMVRLYQKPIAHMVHHRDHIMERHATQTDWETLWEDRRLDVISEQKINLITNLMETIE